MTPVEIATVQACAAVALSANERHFIDKIGGRIERDPDAVLDARETKYLALIVEAHDIEIPSESEGRSGKAREAPSTLEGRGSSNPRESGNGGSDVGTQSAGHILEFHPLANLFPLIEGAEFDELTEDIRENGVRDVIMLLDGKILDGRNRYRSMVRLVETGEILGPGHGPGHEGKALTWNDLDPAVQLWPFEDYDEHGNGDPLDFVLSKNLHRRHLTDNQRASIAAKIANLPRGRPGQNPPIGGVSVAAAAERMSAAPRSAERARVVHTFGVEPLREALDRDDIPASGAEMIARLDPEAQRRIIAEVAKHPDTKAAFRGVVKELRREGQDEKKERRGERERELGRRIRALPEKKYGVILEDFEWDFEVHSRDTGMDRHAANHYETAADAHTPEEIVERTAERLRCAAADCALLMWATVPHLAIALRVMELRGFRYVTNWNWSKDRIGPGYWNRNKHEHLLLGIRGNVPCPAQGDQWESDLTGPVREHSRKPDWQYELIEAYFPSLPKIELNARVDDVAEIRAEWDVWGNEAPSAPDGAGPPPEAATPLRPPLKGEVESEAAA